MYQIKADSRYHIQSSDIWCGAASAMIVLADSDVNVPYSRLTQEDLYNKGHQYSSNPRDWYIDPRGLRLTLNEYAPGKDFRDNRRDNELEGTRDIIAALVQHKIPPATLINDGVKNHWIVVDEAETDVDPSGGGAYTLRGLWIHDPWNGSPSSVTNHCGSDKCPDLGCAHRWVEYATEWRTIFDSCYCGGGQEEFVTVTPKISIDVALPKAGEIVPKFDGHGLAGPEAIRKICVELLVDHGLMESKRSGEALRGAEPGEPVLVARLDQLNEYYYLVPLRKEPFEVGWLQVDGRWGTLRSMELKSRAVSDFASSTYNPGLDFVRGNILSYLEQVNESGGIFLGRDRGVLRFPREVATVSTALVWRPCRESRSPYMPFREVSVGGERVYVRADGAIFPDLTSGLFGA